MPRKIRVRELRGVVLSRHLLLRGTHQSHGGVQMALHKEELSGGSWTAGSPESGHCRGLNRFGLHRPMCSSVGP